MNPKKATQEDFDAEVDFQILDLQINAPRHVAGLVSEMARDFMKSRDNGLPPTGEGLSIWSNNIAKFALAAFEQSIKGAEAAAEAAKERFRAFREKYPIPTPEASILESVDDVAQVLTRKGSR